MKEHLLINNTSKRNIRKEQTAPGRRSYCSHFIFKTKIQRTDCKKYTYKSCIMPYIINV